MSKWRNYGLWAAVLAFGPVCAAALGTYDVSSSPGRPSDSDHGAPGSVPDIASGGDYKDWSVYCLAFFNSFLVAASAGKLRDKSITEGEKKKQRNAEKISESGEPVINEEGDLSDLD